jgi:hypothetical protein
LSFAVAARALLPALVLGVLTFWAGTFAGGAAFGGAVTAHLLVLAVCVLGAGSWSDPLQLGRGWRWLLPALLITVGSSWILGPEPRAGFVGVVLLPAFLLLPAAIASCWLTVEEKRLGLAALGLLFAAVAAISLGLWWEQASPRAAMPLGHHNLLATWLILMWPIALVGLADRERWRPWFVLTGTVGLLALAGTGSFLAVVAFLMQSVIAARWWRPVRVWLLAAAIALLVGPAILDRAAGWWREGLSTHIQESAGEVTGRQPGVEPRKATPGAQADERSIADPLERASRMLEGADGSARFRAALYVAGWEGWKQRPIVGWGPGSVPFTIAEFTRPVAGLNPSGEIIGDLHSTVVHLAYEIGLAGLIPVLALAATFMTQRWRGLRVGRNSRLMQGALIGLTGGGVMLLGNAPVTVLAVPVAIGVVAGSALAATEAPRAFRRRAAVGGTLLYVLAAAVFLAPFETAHFFYQRALSSENPVDALSHVRRAAELDPGFALYKARSAWLAEELEQKPAATAEEALLAAEAASGLAPLWLAAGTLGLDAGRPWATAALERAVVLDPLSPLAAFHLMRSNPDGPGAIALGARAVRAEPRLGGALWWQRHPEIRDAVAEKLPPDRRRGFSRRSRRATGPVGLLVQTMDRQPAASFSLFAFRRSPWPADLAPVEVRVDG